MILEQQREQLIEQINAAFTYSYTKEHSHFLRSLQLTLSSRRGDYYGDRILELFGNKTWDEVPLTHWVIFALTDVDHLRALPDEAFVYYLPAMLLATLQPQAEFFEFALWCHRIRSLLARFNEAQLSALAAFLKYHADRLRAEDSFHLLQQYVDLLEDLCLEILLYLDTRSPSAVPPAKTGS